MLLIIGLASSSAFTFNNTTRAFCSTRINMNAIRPIAMVDDNNRVIATNARKMKAKDFDNRKHKKLQYLLFKYVWEHIDNKNVVEQRNLNKEAFVYALINLHDELCKKIKRITILVFKLDTFSLGDNGTLTGAEKLCPVQVVEQIPLSKRHRGSSSHRPQVHFVRDIEYSWNKKVPTVDWENDSLKFERIVNENIPFDASTIGEVEEEAQETFTSPYRRRRGDDVTMSKFSSSGV